MTYSLLFPKTFKNFELVPTGEDDVDACDKYEQLSHCNKLYPKKFCRMESTAAISKTPKVKANSIKGEKLRYSKQILHLESRDDDLEDFIAT